MTQMVAEPQWSSGEVNLGELQAISCSGGEIGSGSSMAEKDEEAGAEYSGRLVWTGGLEELGPLPFMEGPIIRNIRLRHLYTIRISFLNGRRVVRRKERVPMVTFTGVRFDSIVKRKGGTPFPFFGPPKIETASRCPFGLTDA